MSEQSESAPRGATSHTQGPWTVEHNDEEATHVMAGGHIVCEQIDHKEDATLIAAAPDLLEAAIQAADWLCECDPSTDQYERGMKLRAAIAKAHGDSPASSTGGRP